MRGMRGAVYTTAAACTAAITAMALLPPVDVGGQSAPLHLALETTASLVALLAAFLVVGRLRRRTYLNELVLASGLTVLACSNLLFGTLPLLGVPGSTTVSGWALLAGGLFGALLFALAAYVPRTRLRGPSFVLRVIAGIALAHLVASVLISAITADASHGAAWSSLHVRQAPPAAQVVIAVLYGLAAVGFLRRSSQRGDEFFGWLAIAAVVAAASRLSAEFLRPGLYGASAGEVFRLVFYLVLMVGSMREIWSYWRALSDAAVLGERQRLARDLHDGLAQELAYLARNIDALAPQASAESVSRLRGAVERAQAESRLAIGALSAPANQDLEVVLAETTHEIAERFDIDLAFDSVPGVRLSEHRAEAVLRIAGEAVTNAAKHSGAGMVRLSLTHEGRRVRLRVSDTGKGFDPAARTGGFGLVSIRERAQSVGGELRISSEPGRGCELEALL